MSNLTRSNSNVNNKNNLANVFLKQRLAQFDREEKYSIYHIERSKVSTNHFLSQIKQCDNFLTTGSLELLGRTKEKKPDSSDNVDCADKPPLPKSNTSASRSRSRSPKKRATPSTVPMFNGQYIPPRQRHKLQTLSAVRAEWMKEGAKKKVTDFERGEQFIAKLREKERYFESLNKDSSDEEDNYYPLLRNAKSGITRLPRFRKPSNRPHSSDDRTARSHKTTDLGQKRTGSVEHGHRRKESTEHGHRRKESMQHGQKRKESEELVKRLDSMFENMSLEEDSQDVKADVKFPRVPDTGCRLNLAWQEEEDEEADVDDVDYGDEEKPPEDMMRAFLNLKMKVKPKSLHCRIDEFYSKLDQMKRKEEERTRSLPYYEKKRKWMMLTRGRVSDDFSDTEVY